MTLLERRRAMMIKKSEGDDGLFAYWDGSDDVDSDGRWADRIHGLQISFVGSPTHDSTVYTFSGKTQGGYLRDSIDDYLQYELRCVVECDFNCASPTSGLGARLVEFASYGTCTWNYGFLCGLSTSGTININPKNSSNQAQQKTNATTTGYTAGDWVNNVKVECGIRVVDGDYQQVYASINGSSESKSANLTKVVLQPRGLNGQARYFEVGGRGYSLQQDLTIKIKSIKLFAK